MLFILKENGHMQFFKENLATKDSCEKEHSNCHSEYKDVSKSFAECNVAHFSGSNTESQHSGVYSCKESYSRGKSLHCKKP